MHPTGADFHLTSLEIYALQQVACSNTSVGWVFDWPSGISPYYTEYIYHTQPKGKKDAERINQKFEIIPF
jgi:hypothetical protein